ncbi:Glycosyl hydrolases family 43 [Candidatus Electrothrix laxa]
MQKKSNRYTIQLFVFFIFVLTLPCQGKAEKIASVQQDLVWSQSDGLRHEIFSSTQKDGEWTTPAKVTDNNANNLHPVLCVGSDGTKWFFWSAVRSSGISVEYAVMQNNAWSEPQALPIEQHSAITPSALADKDGGVWLVWAGNDGGNDDIYFSRFQGETWTDPKVVHASNEVPDIKPEIAYNEEGKIEVSWIGFRSKAYKKVASVYTDNTGWSAEQEKLETEEEGVQNEEEQETELPSFLPGDSQFFLKIY